MKEGQLLQELWDLTQVREPAPTIEKCFLRQKYQSVQESRDGLAKMMSEQLDQEVVPPNRLVQLLALGLEYEQLKKQGLSKKPQKVVTKEEQKSIYVQKVVTHKLFNGDFKIQTIALSNSCDYLLIGGQDGLIEVWNYHKMSLDLDTIPY